MKKSTYKYKEPPPLGELTDSIHINVNEIPNHVRDELAAATLEFIRSILRQPGGREALDAKTEERKKRLSAEKSSSIQGTEYDAESVDP